MEWLRHGDGSEYIRTNKSKVRITMRIRGKHHLPSDIPFYKSPEWGIF